jgi:uncharacterized Zn finger protein (UPF0148 family)
VSTDEQGRPLNDGGVPSAFGNTLAWTWARDMPRSLKSSKFLCLLYVLRAMANGSGELRFKKDGKAIRIQDIAAATGCREQDARRYLEAARRAGVVAVIGEPRRGKATLYRLLATAWPSWAAAEEYLKGTVRPRKEEDSAEGSGHSGTNSEQESSVHGGTNQFGPQRPELGADEQEPGRSTVDRMGSGHSGTQGSVHSGPNNPGVTQGVTHELVDVATQAQVVGAEDAKSDSPNNQQQEQATDEPFGRCEECQVPLMRPGRKRCPVHAVEQGRARKPRAGRARPIQAPLMTVVQGDAAGPQQAAEAPQRPVSKIPNPWAPERVCGCGRPYRTGEAHCPLCIELAREETARLAAAHPKASTA